MAPWVKMPPLRAAIRYPTSGAGAATGWGAAVVVVAGSASGTSGGSTTAAAVVSGADRIRVIAPAASIPTSIDNPATTVRANRHRGEQDQVRNGRVDASNGGSSTVDRPPDRDALGSVVRSAAFKYRRVYAVNRGTKRVILVMALQAKPIVRSTGGHAVGVETPTTLEQFGYRTIGWKIGTTYPEWMVDDIRSGRSQRLRFLSCGIGVGGIMVLSQYSLARRTGAYYLMATSGAGVVLGVVLGAVLLRFMDPAKRQDRALRYQGLRPDGTADPAPSGMASLDNYAIGAIQAAAICVFALSAGLVPRLAFPIPIGRCVTPSATDRSALDAGLRPGATVVDARLWHDGRAVFVAARITDPQVPAPTLGVWQRFDNDGTPLFVARDLPAASATAPNVRGMIFGATTTTGGDDGLHRARACLAP